MKGGALIDAVIRFVKNHKCSKYVRDLDLAGKFVPDLPELFLASSRRCRLEPWGMHGFSPNARVAWEPDSASRFVPSSLPGRDRTARLQDGRALEFAVDELKADRDLVLEAVARTAWQSRRTTWPQGSRAAELKVSREVVLAAIAEIRKAVEVAAEELKADRKTAIATDWRP